MFGGRLDYHVTLERKDLNLEYYWSKHKIVMHPPTQIPIYGISHYSSIRWNGRGLPFLLFSHPMGILKSTYPVTLGKENNLPYWPTLFGKSPFIALGAYILVVTYIFRGPLFLKNSNIIHCHTKRCVRWTGGCCNLPRYFEIMKIYQAILKIIYFGHIFKI